MRSNTRLLAEIRRLTLPAENKEKKKRRCIRRNEKYVRTVANKLIPGDFSFFFCVERWRVVFAVWEITIRDLKLGVLIRDQLDAASNNQSGS